MNDQKDHFIYTSTVKVDAVSQVEGNSEKRVTWIDTGWAITDTDSHYKSVFFLSLYNVQLNKGEERDVAFLATLASRSGDKRHGDQQDDFLSYYS